MKFTVLCAPSSHKSLNYWCYQVDYHKDQATERPQDKYFYQKKQTLLIYPEVDQNGFYIKTL